MAMMYLLQGLIICAVVGSNIQWHWTPNQYLASGIGAGLAWIATRGGCRVARSQGPLEMVKKNEAACPRGRPQGDASMRRPVGWASQARSALWVPA